MRIGIYLDLRNPDQWRRPWPDHYRRALDWVVEADRLGIESVWLSEHHGFADGYLPQPLVLAAAIAARTSRIRIGTAVMLAPLRQPLHTAEEAALVDLVSGGRFELGLGAGYRVQEFEDFGADFGSRYRLLETAVTEIREAWSSRLPPPAQQPPPIWLGAFREAGARRAGRLGTGMLALSRRLLPPYLEGLAAAGLGAGAARMAGAIYMTFSDRPERDWPRVLPHIVHQWDSYSAMAREGTGDRMRPSIQARLESTERGNSRWGRVVTPEEGVAWIREQVDGLPVADLHFWLSIAGMPDDLVEAHLDLLARQVRPAVSGAGEVEG
jgi:alkanesulfonate monooxygenase SsuD/methylene tetrahydromethanopterin reductase-like flavin-dependent oxidoreductase (luciferase family)